MMYTEQEFLDLQLALSKPFRFAKSMAWCPHEYTLKKYWEEKDFDSFNRVVLLIRRIGYMAKIIGTKKPYLNINGRRYWTMGDPLDTTWVLNRARNEINSSYNDIAEDYDTIFSSEKYLEEDKKISSMLPKSVGARVLDIGCGTGVGYGMTDWAYKYVGIDPSSKMLTKFKSKYNKNNNFTLFNFKFEEFIPKTSFDLIFALYGSINYVDPKYLDHILYMLKPKGNVFLVFYKDDYIPITYTETGNFIKHYNFSEYSFPPNAEIEEFGNYMIVRYTK